ncbi:hypothetical protein ACERK3_12705 [Phycisphaerales bacterium AB-hyl4]|uniref:Uncharacterized protein n=1 Tax=Natronomicrosphaera hydrolytica TaxID=3242702 RepID=A0ABV4U6B7_9BACT
MFQPLSSFPARLQDEKRVPHAPGHPPDEPAYRNVSLSGRNLELSPGSGEVSLLLEHHAQ